MVTSRALAKIRNWVKTEEREKSVALGKDLLEKEFKKHHLKFGSFAKSKEMDGILAESHIDSLEDLMAAVGYGRVSPKHIIHRFLPEEEGYPGGLYISDKKIEGSFKKFCLALFSIFLLPFILVFGIGLAICVFLLIFPILIAFFPVFFVGLSMLLIIAPAAVPVLIIYIMVTERSLLLINSRGRLFSMQSPSAEEKKTPGE